MLYLQFFGTLNRFRYHFGTLIPFAYSYRLKKAKKRCFHFNLYIMVEYCCVVFGVWWCIVWVIWLCLVLGYVFGVIFDLRVK